MVEIKILIEEAAGIARAGEPVTMGVPFPRGALPDPAALTMTDPSGESVPLQTRDLARWPDGSAKWVLLDFQADVPAEAQVAYRLRAGGHGGKGPVESPAPLRVELGEGALDVCTGATTFHIDRRRFRPFEAVSLAGAPCLGREGSAVVLTDADGAELEPSVEAVEVETAGPLRTTVRLEGAFPKAGQRPLARFIARLHFFACRPLCKLEFTLWNPRTAQHPGGLWDLGDPGSIYFQDLSLKLFPPASEEATVSWREHRQQPREKANGSRVVLYQDSSGGENWRSSNHVNRSGEVRTSFRGYRVYRDGIQTGEGLRAEPQVSVAAEGGTAVTVAVPHFWQNFPKALEAAAEEVAVRLFPEQFDDLFELQGGERKTHTLWVEFSPPDRRGAELAWVHAPLVAHAPPRWYADSGAVPHLVAEKDDPHQDWIDLVKGAVEGENTFFRRREIIDEYGWRNFGDLYADHEAVYHEGSHPLVSHYNNQYDAIYGFLMQYLRTGNPRWFELATDLSAHVKDIDIYHTQEDRPQYNNGLFWHTEHYIDAATATHRCFSRHHLQVKKAQYGGGPSLSHIYTTGLLYHYLLTGSPSSTEAIICLAEYVANNVRMDHTFTNRLIRYAKRSREKLKSVRNKNSPVSLEKVFGLDGPGRASGNAINCLIDAHIVTEEMRYVSFAWHIVSACIKRSRNICLLDLTDTENRWMYTIHITSMQKLLEEVSNYDLQTVKNAVSDEIASFVQWMIDNEKPALEDPEKLEYPNETWAAQEFRKSAILANWSRANSGSSLSDRSLKKAIFLYQDAISRIINSQTRHLTRPIIIMMATVPGYSHASKYVACRNIEKAIDTDFVSKNDMKVSIKNMPLIGLPAFSFSSEIQAIKSRLKY